MTPFAEAWLLAFTIAATLGAGALAVLSVGILLQERWVEPLAPIFFRAGRAMPALILLALPLYFLSGTLYPWAEGRAAPVMLGGGLGILLLWAVLGHLLTRPAPTRRMAGIALLLLVLSGAIGFEDLALSRDMGWVGSLNGLAMLVGGGAAFLGLAVLIHGPLEDPDERTGMERALLTSAVFALWLLFVPFVTVWAADLPVEAAWYLRRQQGFWHWLTLGIILPALVGSIVLAAVPQWGPRRMRLVCALLLVQHVALVLWTVRPDAPLAPGAAHGSPYLWADVIVIGAIGLLLFFTARLAGRADRQSV
ncbi:hypothetical protein J8J14_06525 [Roseomonas sp. SSH11]|uniref:Uncharacterized protein n=1 Tax=Pararoseomonas baculiformis TaxID=2820812 RepID=A0ABS4AC43_9PROT|nr:hypothetical protein [Pararoseomonas baculiformis]MBP0444431.1 hypothetical protein [Pararoseomonas baculiformis]